MNAETIISPNVGDVEGVPADMHELTVTEESDAPSIPSIETPKGIEAPARIKINIPAGLYDLSW